MELWKKKSCLDFWGGIMGIPFFLSIFFVVILIIILIKYNVKKIPSWPTLSNIGNNKIVISSYIWIVIIPILAKFIEQVTLEYKDFVFALELPFSWKLLYLSALFFALATSLYLYFCPNLIKKFSDIEHFKEKGLTKEQLIVFFSTWLREKTTAYDAEGKKINKINIVSQISSDYCTKPIEKDELKKDSLHKDVKNLTIKNEEEVNAYWHIRSVMSNDRLFVRSLITILYSAGFLILLYLLAENINAVFHII
ncbi:hypothetical protein MNB_SV-4-812 [hydrothermal vent metagenome]|uniref:Uncharacterized protein n=1 Tax=hydrothermal vent metagenome TaxID=652676 RepID=A0A1W1E880_9ZZZZ